MIFRRIGAVLLGLIIAVAFVQIAELGVHAIKPAPPGMSMRDMDAIKAYVASLPLSALLLELGGWLIGTLLGAWAAARIGRTPMTAYALGGILLCVGVYTAFVIPQPVWFSITTFVIYAVGAMIGARLGT